MTKVYVYPELQGKKSKICLTLSAFEHLHELFHARKKEVYFRVRVSRDRNLKLTYTMIFDQPNHLIPGDKIYNFSGLKIIVDARSLTIIEQLAIDYQLCASGRDGKFEFVDIAPKKPYEKALNQTAI